MILRFMTIRRTWSWACGTRRWKMLTTMSVRRQTRGRVFEARVKTRYKTVVNTTSEIEST